MKIEKLQMESYAEYIQNLAESDSQLLFYNSSASHAVVVLTQIFKKAQKSLSIYCGNMMTFEISNNQFYINGLRDFLKDGSKKLRIMFADPQEAFRTSEICKMLQSYKSQVEIKALTDKSEIKYDNKSVHFTIGDDSIYRLETDIQNKVATGCFNDSKTVEVLKNIFNKYYIGSATEFNW